VSAAIITLPLRAFLITGVRAYREPLARALAHNGIEIAGTAPDAASALPCIGELQPDAVLVEAVTADQRWSVAGLRAVAPDVPIVALGVPDRAVDAVGLVEAGASGYATRDQSVEEIATIVRSVVRGEFPCSGRVAAVLASRVSELTTAGQPPSAVQERLTAREREIAELIAAGLPNKEIAAMLTIELATVKNHVHSILAKLGVTRRAEVAARLHGASAAWNGVADAAALQRLE
jgi:two-component system, NarL family, nitrate/nitrite response regulator NarL